MNSLSQSVAATLQYAQFFDFDLTFFDLHHRLITSQPVSQAQLKDFLNKHPHFKEKLHLKPTPKRRQKTKISHQKLKTAQKYTNFLKHLPTIQLVAATGSPAVLNAKIDDDIDILLVTSPHTLWLTRPLVFLLTKLFFNRRRPHRQPTTQNDICNNLWLDTTALSLPADKRNLYTAHEIIQIQPLFDRHSTYQRLLTQNSWVENYLANAYHSLTQSQPPSSSPSPFNFLFTPLNALFFTLQYLYMLPKLTRETITLHSAYFHPRSLYPQIRSQLTNLTDK